jgi:hypothetical protein
VKLPEDGVNDAETCSSDVRLCLSVYIVGAIVVRSEHFNSIKK